MMFDFNHIAPNGLVANGFLLGIAAALWSSLKDVPHQIILFVKRQSFVSITIQSTDPLFYHVTRWLDEQPYMKKARLLEAGISNAMSTRSLYGSIYGNYAESSDPMDESRIKVFFFPAVGQHILRYRKRLIWLTHERDDKSPLAGPKQETLTLHYIGRSQNYIREILETILQDSVAKRKYRQRIYTVGDRYWNEYTEKAPRDLDSIVLAGDIKQQILSDIEWFTKAKAWYTSRGLPYRRGYMLTGKPGNGKSSLVAALAGYFKKDIYILSLSSPKLGDTELLSLLTEVSDKGVILLEDADAAFVKREAKENDSVLTFSGLLNALDGVATRDGQVFFMTTNHPELLDPALVRPGRIDVSLELNNATTEQIEELYSRFFPEDPVSEKQAFASLYGNGENSVAFVQNELLRIHQHRSGLKTSDI